MKDIKLFDEKNRLTKEAIENAKKVSVKDYLEEAGYTLVKEGSHYYSMAEHNSFKINTKKNEYYWNSRGRGGTAIQLLCDEELFNYDFRSAVIELNTPKNERLRNEYGMRVDQEREKEPYHFPQDKMVKGEPVKAINYLVNERKLNSDIVNKLAIKGFIRQDEKNNVVYPWGKDGEIVGHNSEGTYQKEGNKRFKHINQNGEQSYGFSFQTGQGEVKNHFYFESEVDAISYVSLNGLTPDSKYFSMRGINNQALVSRSIGEHVLKYDKVPNLVFCVDNDQAGKNFNKEMISKSLEFRGKEVPMHFAVPPEVNGIKDWNDLLKSRDGKAFEPVERTPILSKQAYLRREHDKLHEKDDMEM